MKKIAVCLMATCLSLTFLPLVANASAVVASSVLIVPPASAAADALLLRLNEIKTMDKSGMNSSEKKDLRKEVRSIKHELKRNVTGVYISVGAVIIIVLLLILIL